MPFPLFPPFQPFRCFHCFHCFRNFRNFRNFRCFRRLRHFGSFHCLRRLRHFHRFCHFRCFPNPKKSVEKKDSGFISCLFFVCTNASTTIHCCCTPHCRILTRRPTTHALCKFFSIFIVNETAKNKNTVNFFK